MALSIKLLSIETMKALAGFDVYGNGNYEWIIIAASSLTEADCNSKEYKYLFARAILQYCSKKAKKLIASSTRPFSDFIDCIFSKERVNEYFAEMKVDFDAKERALYLWRLPTCTRRVLNEFGI
jgi:hypothetical protein